MRICWLLLLIVLTGCPNNFVEPWEVAKPRIMLAKVLIDGDTEGRSRPRQGETFSIEMYMISPERPQENYTAQISTCLGTVLPNGTLGCASDANFSDITTAPYAGDDRVLFTGFIVPPFLDQLPPPLDTLDRVSMFGAVCVDGQVERVPEKDVTKDAISTLYRCVDNEASKFPTELPYALSFWVDRDTPDGMNHHPSFACDEDDSTSACNEGVELDDEQVPGSIVLRVPEKIAGGEARTFVWEPWDATQELPWDNCAEAPESMPRVHVGDEAYEIYFRFDPSDRESYQRKIKVNTHFELEERREELVISHALTTKGGSLDGFTSVVRYTKEDSEAQASVEYRPPQLPKKKKIEKDPVPPEGRLVRFYFGLRDQRGGVDFTTRELCLLPRDAAEAASDD